MLKSKPLSEGIGIEVEGVDLSKPFSQEVGQELFDLFSRTAFFWSAGKR